MLLFILLSTLFNIPLSNTENEDFQRVCAGRDFRLPVYSASRIVTFTPNYPPGPRRVLLDKNDVKDPRFEWTRDRTLLLREVTHSDQGLYSIKLPSGFTYETVRLTVSDCIKSVRRGYGETFQYSIPKEGSLLEFVPRGSPPETLPVVLWNQSDHESAVGSRGRVQQDGRIWVAEMVTQADQGNYTVRDGNGKILSRSTLAVHGHTFNVTHFPKESLNIPLFLPLPYAHLIFTPTPHHDDPPVSTFDLYPPRGPMQLIRDGQIVEQDARYRSLISVSRNGGVNEVVISRLSSRHDGVYEVRDREGNLVSSTSLHVIDKTARWRAVLKSITVPSGLFVTLAGFILFMKRFPSCGVAQIINGLRAHQPQAANPPHVNVQDFSAPSPQHSGLNNQSELPRTPTKWSCAPVRSGYSPVLDREPRPSPEHTGTGGQVEGRQKDETSTNNMLSAEDPDSRKRRTSISVPGASDCLRLSEDCARFPIKKEGGKERWSKADDFFSTLPLDTDTSGTCSIYTSDKLDFS